jgi:hypothetical protein
VGDTWKAIVAIARRRPDLHIRTVLAPPSGLVVIRRLDPSSTLLAAEFEQIIAMLREDRYTREPGEWPEEFQVVPNTPAGLAEALGS